MFKKILISSVTIAALSMPALAQNSGASQYQYFNWLNNKNNQSQAQTNSPANTSPTPVEHRNFNNNSTPATSDTFAATPSSENQTHSQRSGLYLSLGAGATFPADSSIENLGIDNSESLNVGPSATGAIGLYLGDFRFEAEAGYRYNDLSSFTLGGVGVSASGHLESLSLMGNLYYDIPLSPTIDWYIGGGAGSAQYHTSVTVAGLSASGGSDWKFAYQGMTGLSFQLDKKIYLTVGYRYFSSLNPTINGAEFQAPDSHEATVGLRIDL